MDNQLTDFLRMLTRSHKGNAPVSRSRPRGFDEAFRLVAASNWHKSTIAQLEIRILVVLRVTEVFSSIQGESTHAGRPCTFVRLTGCPMRCSWCDSEYTCTGGDHLTIDSIHERVRELG